MIERTEGYVPSHDIKAFDFTKDLEFGHQGEERVLTFLTDISNGSFEVKYDRYRNGRMFIEFEQNPRNTGWKRSGIQITTAKWWVYLFSPSAFVIVETDRLRRYIHANQAVLPQRIAASQSDNPAKGYLVYPEAVKELMSLSIYD
jgi:hypothetical protein